MEQPPGDLTEDAVCQGLRHFGIDAQEIAYAPLGFGDHHWRVVGGDGNRWFATVAALDHKPHCGDGTAAALDGLRRAMRTALALRTSGLEFVVAPVTTAEGDVVVGLSARYALSVFPVVEGESGHFGQVLDPAEGEAVQELLARLHSTATPAGAPRCLLALPGRDGVAAAFTTPPAEWDTGPHGPPARSLLMQHAEVINARLGDFDRLAERVSARGHTVVTHGEPHPGNLIRTDAGLHLVDWDTVGIAVPERDLSLLSDDPATLTTYRDLTGYRPSAEALRLHRLRWGLIDVIEFVEWFRAPHAHGPDTDRAWASFEDTLAALSRD
ncbi:aminoglycoside phosphotransferase family protein [Actinokineospora sp. PR83]|uniref:phosphotransferase n=1 Tax=Actinokineospora sp. PR83 TaxID=2884908 RepID=UPI0027E0A68D|nr:phosphotransferase [Actinokineospora sp. PR83]MCG8915850.1 aminoglycoside phosphotransferase family protein [Actinokineospora sp. PR83]